MFLALKAHIDNYNKLQSDFSKLIKGRWVPEENLHITVCYFGDTYSIDEIFQKMPPLNYEIEELELSSLGYFKHNNILYAETNSQKLETLQLQISDIFSLSNVQIFIPHVTLIRIKKIEDEKAFIQMLNNYKGKHLGKIESRLELIQSHIIHPGGAKYESIRKY